MVVQQLTVLLHGSLDPYNTTEEMALTWEKVVMDWTNGKKNLLTIHTMEQKSSLFF